MYQIFIIYNYTYSQHLLKIILYRHRIVYRNTEFIGSNEHSFLKNGKTILIEKLTKIVLK